MADIIDFTRRKPEAAALAAVKHLDQEDRQRRQRKRQEALSRVRALAEAVDDLLYDPLDDFSRNLVERLLPQVNEALEQGWLK